MLDKDFRAALRTAEKEKARLWAGFIVLKLCSTQNDKAPRQATCRVKNLVVLFVLPDLGVTRHPWEATE